MLARLARRLTRQPLHTFRVPIPMAHWRLSASAVALHLRYASVAAPPVVTLRPYQQECVDACLDALSSGKHRIGVSLPTSVGWSSSLAKLICGSGSGKTTIFADLIPKIPTRGQNGTKVSSAKTAREIAGYESRSWFCSAPSNWHVKPLSGSEICTPT